MRHTLHRLLALLLSALLCIAALSGCTLPPQTEQPMPDTPAEETPVGEEVPATLADYPFTLPWYRNEGYNPYLTNNTLTLQLADLLFEKLVTIAPDGALEYRIVRAAQVQGTTVTLHIRSDYRFADGRTVTAQDVAACINAARSSQLYKGRFAHVKTAVAAEDGTVTIQLSEPDHLFVWLLDIPVMPAGETSLSTPCASGPYTYADDEDALIPNPLSGTTAPFAHITLLEMTGADALANSLNIGTISLYSSEAEGRANGINSSRQESYFTNTLVFLGFNSIAWRSWKTLDETGAEIWHSEPTGSAPLLADARGRQAVESLLDRALLLEKVYYNQGHVALGYLNSVGPEGSHGILSAGSDSGRTAALLGQLGYKLEMDGFYHLDDGSPDEKDRLTLRLLVYTGSSYKRYLAQLIADSLTTAGIYVMVEECDSMENYRQKLTLLDFDMYIGEIKLYNNMDMSAFLREGGAANGGLTLSDGLLESYALWRAGTTNAAQLENALAAEMPWAPLLWRSGTLYYAKALEGFSPSASSVFYGIGSLRLA